MEERIIAELQALFAGESSGHDLFHTLRVTRTAQRIASQLPCDRELVTLGAPALTLFFQGFFMMSFQFSGQAVYVALNRPRSAVFFSLLRKAVIVVPLTLALPHFFGLGVNGVFLAEPISNYIGGAACYITMLLTVWRDLKKADAAPEAAK